MADKKTPMNLSGFCKWPGRENKGHQWCTSETCPCKCHIEKGEVHENATRL